MKNKHVTLLDSLPTTSMRTFFGQAGTKTQKPLSTWLLSSVLELNTSCCNPDPVPLQAPLQASIRLLADLVSIGRRILFTFQSSPLQYRDEMETMDIIYRGRSEDRDVLWEEPRKKWRRWLGPSRPHPEKPVRIHKRPRRIRQGLG